MRTIMIFAAFALVAGCDDGGGDVERAPDVTVDVSVPLDAGPLDAGETPTLVATPLGLDFGVVAVGGQGSLALTLSNPSGVDLEIVEFEGLVGPFSSARRAPLMVPAGAQRIAEMRFNPDEAGAVEGTLVLHLAEGASVTVQLNGVGAGAEASLETAAVDVGTVAPGEGTSGLIRVRNLSSAVALNLGQLEGISSPFSIPDGQLPQRVAPEGTGEVLVQFSPQVAGDHEQWVVLSTDAGSFEVVLRGRAVAAGALTIHGVSPAWGPTDQPVSLVIYGGPWPAGEPAVWIGETALTEVERLDDERIRGVLPAGGVAVGSHEDARDVRVEVSGSFGVLPQGFIQTGPVAAGASLDLEALSGVIEPAGNPWQLAVDEVPAGATLTLAPGVVVLGAGRTLTVRGTLSAGGDGGLVVFSTAEADARWGGLVLDGEAPSNLVGVVVEGAGAAEGAAVTVHDTSGLTSLSVWRGAGDGVRVVPGGTLALIGGHFSDLAGDAVHLEPGSTVFRLVGTEVRRVRWPVALSPEHLGGRPLGAGHDWAANVGEGIGVAGVVEGELTWVNQPAGLRCYLRGPVVVNAEATLRLAPSMPLVIDGLLTVEGRLEWPEGLVLSVGHGGYVEVNGVLFVGGTEAAPVRIEAGGEVPAPGAWRGLSVGATGRIEGAHLVLRDAGAEGPAVSFDGAAGVFEGLEITDSADVGLRLAGDATLTALVLVGNPGGLQIDGGAGLIEGRVSGPVRVNAPCADWDLSGLQDTEGRPVVPVCP